MTAHDEVLTQEKKEGPLMLMEANGMNVFECRRKKWSGFWWPNTAKNWRPLM